jgi:enoyl-CoA hydratase/carnithine racemase
MRRVDLDGLLDLLGRLDELESTVTAGTSPLIVVDLPDDDSWAHLPCFEPPRWQVLVARSRRPVASAPVLAGFDVLVSDGDDEPPGWVRPGEGSGSLDQIVATCERAPLAAATLAQVLRAGDHLTIGESFTLESLAYSMLLAGPEFAAWLGSRKPRAANPRPPDPEPVLVDDDGSTVTVTLNRPEVRNAYSAQLRDALVDVLRGLAALPEPPPVVLRGNGVCFCSGGDLTEFGTTPDPVTAHAVRTSRAPGLLIHALGDAATVSVHGPCVGAGTELTGFAAHVEAAPGTTFRLPEVAMGLLPGAGGTASLPRRIGRHRTAWMALTGAALDVQTALEWRLVDRVTDNGEPDST